MTEPPPWQQPPGQYGPPPQGPPPWSPPGPQQGSPQWSPPGPQQWVPPAPKPGVVPLRPLGLGEILDGAFTYIRTGPAATLGLSAVVITITQLIQIPVTIFALGPLYAALGSASTGRSARPEELVDAFAGGLGGTGIGALITFLGTTLLSGMLIVVLSRAVLGHPTSIGEAWARARPRLLGLLGISLLTGLALVGVVAVAAAPAVLVGLGGGPGIAIGLLAFAGVVLAIIAMIYLAVSWSLAAPVYVLEGIGVTASFGRSRRLVAPQWWRVLGITILAGIISAVVSSILAVPFSLIANAVTGGFTDPTAVLRPGAFAISQVIGGIGAILAGTVTAPFTAGVRGLVYIDQRMRREGLDIELQRSTAR